ncbi:hypothetical protein vBYenM636_15 [Yersinia phage vB_YenM_636]|nr:hypothetical protein vBYenM12_15 [Yersinia phage vB_YenM_12]QKN86357.1 hypothetical protein vBYenM22_15 [Yersinia phage vB_YenM_22]QKN86448.1 hypothetical protein vBYenM25_15 [Yersinia phage vB_YenM_25]QKN86539.1 hypothetical protein vBYenM27_15 [Yersinia phage vB_YenM_27]QKN86630.1 hypothetical protein vBYenM39_15 [Yersinia phage vB_YenM_39]QKN86721.1 hypothetical protein vBYenM126_15 [Yersinia phage vB_YenM_126]QKN86812.1 hypothetical protein vBYenM526-1_15 [Yersinia phage vB_YenM_526-1]
MTEFDKLDLAVKQATTGRLSLTIEQARNLINEFKDANDLCNRMEALIEKYEDLNASLHEALDKEKEACKEWRLKAYADQQAVISMQAVVDNLTRQLENIKKVIK